MTRTQSQQTSHVPFSSSTWFITGIGRGLGRSIAEEVLRRGGSVAGTVRNLSHADGLKARFPGRLWIGHLDLSDLANIGRSFQAAVEHFGRVHAVVSNAGYSVLGAAEELQSDAIRRIVDTNLLGSIELARVAIAHMRVVGGGRLVQISSGAGQAGFAGLSIYCATKWGIEGFFESLALEVAPFGIQTTLVEPGAIRTGFGDSGVLSPELDAYREGPAGVLRKMATDGFTAPGDPAKMAKAIVDTFETEAAPMRLALGPDVFRYIKTALTTRLEQVEAQKSVTMSTDCDDIEIAKIG
jgi:NAD(P)-dependent dehydrogenase (short-subunit alcohol dehydrogenase family)